MARLLPEDREDLVNLAVKLSFWIGGITLVAIKGLALFLSGSKLVKASMFESLGDIISSSILALTQVRSRDVHDLHLYPTGKRRFTPLGILCFAAFAVSSMTGLIIQNLQEVFQSDDDSQDSSAVLRRLFEEQPRLRKGLQAEQLEALILQYGRDEDVIADDSTFKLMVSLIGVCIFIKGMLLVFCRHAARQADSEIAKTLSMDHRNDVLGNSVVMGVFLATDTLRRRGQVSPWLDKVDPVSSVLLASWIFYCWLTTGLEQLTVLSNYRAEDEHMEALIAFTKKILEPGPFAMSEVEAYHIGDGYAARVTVHPKVGVEHTPSEVAAALDALEHALLTSDLEVHEVHAKLRPVQASGSKSSSDMSWAAQYHKPAT